MNPATIDKWFPSEQQHKYVSLLKGRVGVTRRRAEYFVKLWAYLLLKQHEELGKPLKPPLTKLNLPQGFVACTHREAHELFYTHQDRGSERAAGMMLDKLVALGLIEKDFDGNSTCIRIPSSLAAIDNSTPTHEDISIVADIFNPRTDAIPVASFLAHNYNWMNKKTTAVPQRIARILRNWFAQYPTGMRVIRREDNQDPIGFYVLYPTTMASEENFFLPPSKSLHLSTTNDNDPIQMAKPGDGNCTSIFVRSCQIDARYQNGDRFYLLLTDAQATLKQMQADFPNLCDLYTLAINPSAEELASAVGFRKTGSDPQSSLYWMYMALDNFLAMDMKVAISSLKFNQGLLKKSFGGGRLRP